MYQGLKAELLTATTCINTMHQIWKEQSDHNRAMAEKKQFWNSKYQMLRQHLIKIKIINNQNPVLSWQLVN